MPDAIYQITAILVSTNAPGGGGPEPEPDTNFLLLETGDYLLQEDGTSKIVLE